MPPTKRAAPSSTTSQANKKAKLDTVYRDASTQTKLKPPAEKIGFFHLPGEIREMIYSYSCVYQYRRAAVTSGAAYEGCPQRSKKEPTIAGTCKQAREESLSVYYSQVRRTYGVQTIFTPMYMGIISDDSVPLYHGSSINLQ